jgi:signal transduction histidine kinase
MEIDEETGRRHWFAGDEKHMAEIAYQKRLNRWITIVFAPSMLFYAILTYHQGYYLEAVFIFLMFINAVVALILGVVLNSLENLIRMKWVTAGIAFGLLAAALINGIISISLYWFLPWVFFYPLVVMLFFRKRIGIYWSLVFCSIVAVIIVMADPPVLDAQILRMIKLNAVVALFGILFMAYISERVRLRVQNDLVASQEEYKLAEQRQRESNLELQHEIERRIQSEEALVQSEMRYRALFEESAISLWEEDWSQAKAFLDTLPSEVRNDLNAYLTKNSEVFRKCINLMQIKAVNRATLNLYEAETVESLLKNVSKILPPRTTNYLLNRMISLYHTGRYNAESMGQTLKGRQLHVLVTSTVPAGFEKSWEKVYTSVYDITERVAMEQEKKRLDQQLQHARQMQAVATLAGGIAHQFNNALSVIYGRLDLLQMSAKGDSEGMRFIRSLKKSTDQMSKLTDQLLAYARGGKYEPKAFSANDLIQDILDLKKIVSDPQTRITIELDRNLHRVKGDTTQISMVLEAVLSNAMEAIDNHGEVVVRTRNQFVDKSKMEPDMPISSGQYVVVCIEDNGTGMDEETSRRMFEPFFTTKIYGRGLGMAASYGIVSNHDGMITVQSTLNKGTQVSIYLPSSEE